MFHASKNIILASQSPRRKALLEGLDMEFRVETKPTEENFPKEMDVKKVAIYLAEKKADAFGKEDLKENEILITADTVVIVGQQILNKPANREEAIQMLELLSGKKHLVMTGMCFKDLNKKICLDDCTAVYFKNLEKEEINYYIDRYQPYDKAGSYGIQEWIGFVGITRIEGSYFNVMGLPLHKIQETLTNW